MGIVSGTLKSESRIRCLPQVLVVIIINNYISLTDNERFQGGTLVGTYDGIARDGELITIEASEVSLEGRYVVLQKDNKDLDEAQWQLHVGDFAAFGEYTTKKTGITHTIQKQTTFQSNNSKFFLFYNRKC